MHTVKNGDHVNTHVLNNAGLRVCCLKNPFQVKYIRGSRNGYGRFNFSSKSSIEGALYVLYCVSTDQARFPRMFTTGGSCPYQAFISSDNLKQHVISHMFHLHTTYVYSYIA